MRYCSTEVNSYGEHSQSCHVMPWHAPRYLDIPKYDIFVARNCDYETVNLEMKVHVRVPLHYRMYQINFTEKFVIVPYDNPI